MASALATILADVFNAKLIVKAARKRSEPPSRRRFIINCLGEHPLRVPKVDTVHLSVIFQSGEIPVKELLWRRRVAFRMLSTDGMRPMGYE